MFIAPLKKDDDNESLHSNQIYKKKQVFETSN